jgi:DNA-binding SARP family transcriptional activator
VVLQVRLLGPFEVVRDGVLITPSAPKLRRVLALLAMHGNRVVRADQIIEELWEDRPPSSAITTLQTYVYQLRKLLGWSARSAAPTGSAANSPDAQVTLCTTPGGYVLGLPWIALDTYQFERLAAEGRARMDAGDPHGASESMRKALRLWRGPVLTAVGTGPILQAEAVRLEELCKSVTEMRIEADMQLGRHADLIGELTGIVAQQPTHEGFQAKLMLTLHRAGRRSEALQTFQRARAALSRELGLEPSTELQRLHQAVLNADPSLEQPSTGIGTVRRPKPAEPPSQLPPDVSHLVGRQRSLEPVRRALSGGDRAAPPVVLVLGAPGSGKSTFVVHAAHRLRADYPDGTFHARLLGPDGTAADPAELLEGFLRAVGVLPEYLPTSLADRVGMFRSWTASRRALVVLDDAVDIEQVDPLLPSGPGCATIVASRRRLSHPGMGLTVTLPPLPPGDAYQLLSDVLGPARLAAEADAVRGLVELCDGLPVALCAAAERLQMRPHWRIARLLARRPDNLGFPEPSLAEPWVMESFRTTYRLLPAADQAALLRLAVAVRGETLAPVEAARLLGVDEGDAERLLENLVEVHLAEVEGAAGAVPQECFRYRFRALFQALARTLARGSGPAVPMARPPVAWAMKAVSTPA